MEVLSILNIIVGILFTVCTGYQMVFAVLRLFGKIRDHGETQRQCHYGVLIAARNEEKVVGHLIDSIKRQDYPSELVDVYVIADNCDDDTAAVAQAHGARVFVRFNKEQVGKGYALKALLQHIREDYPDVKYDGYFIFDADNLLHKNYIKEMNRVFSNGNHIVTGYRNTKNYDDNWITAGYGLYFLRESEQLNRERDYVGVSSFVSGTGYLFASELLGDEGDWRWLCLTEDLQFTADMISRGERVAYCYDAILYDEQPRSFMASLIQRRRWIKGYFQTLKLHGKALVNGLFKRRSFSCYDMLMNLAPLVLTTLNIILNIALLITGLTSDREHMWIFIVSFFMSLGGAYLVLYLLGLMSAITERKRIRASMGKIIMYSFSFPIFVFTFCFSVIMAAMGKVTWQPVRHSVSVGIEDIDKDHNGAK